MFDHDHGVYGLVGLLGKDPKGVCMCVGISRDSYGPTNHCSVIAIAMSCLACDSVGLLSFLEPKCHQGCWHVQVIEEAIIQVSAGGSQTALTRPFWPNDSPVLVSWPPPPTLTGWNHVGNTNICR